MGGLRGSKFRAEHFGELLLQGGVLVTYFVDFGNGIRGGSCKRGKNNWGIMWGLLDEPFVV